MPRQAAFFANMAAFRFSKRTQESLAFTQKYLQNGVCITASARQTFQHANTLSSKEDKTHINVVVIGCVSTLNDYDTDEP